MRWFGESWGAYVCRLETRADVPVGQPCARCGEDFAPNSRGLILPVGGEPANVIATYHLTCFLSEVGVLSEERP